LEIKKPITPRKFTERESKGDNSYQLQFTKIEHLTPRLTAFGVYGRVNGGTFSPTLTQKS
jgi:hypothetical protein